MVVAHLPAFLLRCVETLSLLVVALADVRLVARLPAGALQILVVSSRALYQPGVFDHLHLCLPGSLGSTRFPLRKMVGGSSHCPNLLAVVDAFFPYRWSSCCRKGRCEQISCAVCFNRIFELTGLFQLRSAGVASRRWCLAVATLRFPSSGAARPVRLPPPLP